MATLYKDINIHFNEIISDFPEGITKETTLKDLEILCKEQNKDYVKAKRAIKKYIYLTYTEFNLYREGLLPKTFWEHWLKGIISGYKTKFIMETFEKDFLQNFHSELFKTSLSEDFMKFILEIKNKPEYSLYEEYLKKK